MTSKTSAQTLPLGLTYLPDFIAPALEEKLIAQIDHGAWNHDLKRRTQHFGYRYDYQAKTVLAKDRLGALPEWLVGLANQLVEAGFFSHAPDQVIVNEYEPSQGIAPHIDCLPCFGETIASVSLLSSIMMDFDQPTMGEKASFYLAPRSVLVLQGAAREFWRHGIAARKSDIVAGERIARRRRLSLTFRQVLLAK